MAITLIWGKGRGERPSASTIFTALLCNVLLASCYQAADEGETAANGLAGENSPYLLQHAHNPVNWQPWGEPALKKAQEENKLIVVSIGYSACHWCHVMEKESFADTTVAQQMNRSFISIKVDREERPDVDQIYMTACQLTNDNCGWPLNAIALPDGRPVFVGAYFPKKQWLNVLSTFEEEWQTNPAQMISFANELAEGVEQSNLAVFPKEEPTLSKSIVQNAHQNLIAQVDQENGGLKGAPKFPLPARLGFLLDYAYYHDAPEASQAVSLTLRKMAEGGIYDHLGGGFARYSVDEEWRVPHFEKMLYDNAQLLSLYSKAYRATKEPAYEKIVRETLLFIGREMTNDEGGFYSSIDADSEGEEGAFYTWTAAEIDETLDASAEALKFYYHIEPDGNWERGENVLYTSRERKAAAMERFGLSETALDSLLVRARRELFLQRQERERPIRDDKALCAWNALTVKAYIDAHRAFRHEEYLNSAKQGMGFMLHRLKREGGGLWRSYRSGKAQIIGFLDDYAFTIEALIQLYQVTFQETYLQEADRLAEYVAAHFADERSDMFFYAEKGHDELISRSVPLADESLPSANAVMAQNLFVLGHLLADEEKLESAKRMCENMQGRLSENGAYYAQWGTASLAQLNEPFEVAIVGENWKRLRLELDSDYRPDALLLGGQDEGSLPLLKNKAEESRTLIYVCRNKSCKRPVETVEQAQALLRR